MDNTGNQSMGIAAQTLNGSTGSTAEQQNTSVNANTSNEDVITQGADYVPSGEGYSGASPDAQVVGDMSQNVQNNSAGSSQNKMLLLISVGIVGVIFVVIVVIVLSMQAKKKKEAEELAQAESLLEEEVVEPSFMYTQDEVEALRLAGYTGYEIEDFEIQEQDAKSLIDAAEAARKAQYEMEILPYFDSSSDEFKELCKDTWVGQEELEFDTDVEQYQYFTETINVDYEKLPATGHQLFIKYTLTDGTACFMTVTPERYTELKDHGNIVISVQYTKTGDGKRIITSSSEVIP